MTDSTEVFALRYATMHGRRASEVYSRYDVYGVEDRTLEMDCYFWLIRNGSTLTLVDTGWNRHRGLPRTDRYRHITVEEYDPVALLAQLDVAPQDIDNIVVSHMHFDHIGNLDLFPDATLIVARDEYECWTGPFGAHPVLSLSVLPDEVASLQRFRAKDRLQLVDGRKEIVQGVFATPVGGHTPGQMLVDVVAGSSTVILASDAVHYHEELEQSRPFYHFTDLVAMLDTYESLRHQASSPGSRIVSGHDPVEMRRYVSVADNIVDLTRPLPSRTAWSTAPA